MEKLIMYPIELVNPHKIHKEITDSNCIENFNGVLFTENELSIYGDSILDQLNLDSIVANHTIEAPLDDEITKYYQRQNDGKSAIIKMMAELRLNAIALNLPRSVNREIENKYWEVTVAINNGWWITAKEKAELVAVEGVVTQGLYDSILAKINGYIALNY
jgi:hypothetical protein